MIYVSSSAIKSTSIEECLNELIKLGIQNIELSGGTEFSENISGTIKGLKNKFSLNLLVHNYFPPPKEDFVLNIASSNADIRGRSMDLIKASIDLACEIGSDRYSVHAGYTKHFDPSSDGGYFIPGKSHNISSGEALNIMHSSLSEIRKYADGRKIKTSVENLFPIADAPGSSLLCTPSEILEFLDSAQEAGDTGFLLDLGHLAISSNHLNFDKDKFINELLKRYHSKITGIHISGNDGKTDRHGPLSADSWQLKTAGRFNLKNIPVTLECRGLKNSEILNQYKMVKRVLERNIQKCCTT